MVTARMAGFNPGTSPPPVKIAIVPLFFIIILYDLTLFAAGLQVPPTTGFGAQN
jgi:hypothetical protein